MYIKADSSRMNADSMLHRLLHKHCSEHMEETATTVMR